MIDRTMAPRSAMPLWLRCLITVLLLSAGSLAQDCTRGFMDRNLLTARATKISLDQPDTTSPNVLAVDQFLIIPGMNFSCSGTITGFKLGLDLRVDQNSNRHLQIYLFRPENSSGQVQYQFITFRNILLADGSFSPNGVSQYDLITDIDFISGDVIGVFRRRNSRTRLYYSTQVSGPAGLDIVINRSDDPVPSAGQDRFSGYLLLRPVVTNNVPGSCINGFLSDSELVEQTRLVNINGVVSRPEQQRLFPNIQFTCNGFITKWIVGAQTRNNGNRMPELQIWQLNAGSTNSYTKTNSSLITPNEIPGSPNVHEYILSTPLQFNTGDILGVHQPHLTGSMRSRFVLYYQENTGPTNYVQDTNDPQSSFALSSPDDEYDYPLVSVEFVTALPSTTVLPSTTLPIAVVTSSISQITSTSTISETSLFVATSSPSSTAVVSSTPLIASSSRSPPVSVSAAIAPDNRPTTTQVPHTTETPFSRSVSSGSVPRATGVADGLSRPSVIPLVAGVLVSLLAVGLLIALAVVIVVILVTRARSKGNFKIKAATVETQSVDSEKQGAFDNPIYGSGNNSPETRSNFPLVGYEIYSEPEAMENTLTQLDNAIYSKPDSESTENTLAQLDNAIYSKPESESTDNTLVQFDNAIYSTGNENYSTPGQQWNERDQYETPFTPEQNGACSIYSYCDTGVFVPTNVQRQTLGLNRQQQALRDDIYESLGAVQNSANSPLEFFQEDDIYWAPGSDTASLYQQLARKKYREIIRQQITTSDQLGSGQFGQVNRGIWRSQSASLAVAVKTLKTGASEEEKIKFLQEAAIMGQFHHPNIVKLHGVVTVGEPVIIVIELMKQGDLRQYLHKLQPAPGEMAPSSLPQQLLGYCRQIASGMEYLSKKSFVHRDLAARNILVDDERTCKIADFGMSRDLYDDGFYVSHGGKIPIKWTAPEALGYRKYSTASDVWSFGVLMYEIWSLGHKPFEGYTNNETVELVESGYRLPPPPGCPKAVYKMMMDCWHPETSGRPQFSRLVSRLSQPENELLKQTDKDKTNPQSTMLGAPLETASNLHSDLQKRYQNS